MAYKLLNLTNNQYSSALNLTSQLQINSNNSISQFTKYTPNSNSIQNAESEQELIKIPQNSSINLQLSNHDSDNLYYLVFEINPSQEILIYTNPQCKYIKPEETKLLPSNGDSFKWFINGNKGLGELIIICAKSPFRRTVEVLNKTNGSKLQNEQVFLVKESVNVVRAMLRDLHNGSELNSNNDFYHLDVNHWTTFNFVYQVV